MRREKRLLVGALMEKRALWGTVVSGLESVAAQELKRKIPDVTGSINWTRGKLCFTGPVPIARELKGLNRLHLTLFRGNLELQGGQDHRVTIFKALLQQTDWPAALKAWEESFKTQLPGGIDASLQALAQNTGASTKSDDSPLYAEGEPPKFRVTSTRSHEVKQDFASVDCARDLGTVVGDAFGWRVNLKDFHIEIVINVVGTDVHMSLALTTESLGNREMPKPGPTALRASQAFLLCQLADPKPGEVVMDPMCGSGSIPVELSTDWPLIHVLAGDNHENGVQYTRINVDAKLPGTERVDVVRWDARHLPLETGSVDAIVVDLPFGKRLGSRTTNRSLYPPLFKEWGRVVKRGGRVVVLTADRGSVSAAVREETATWHLFHQRAINHGGLNAAVLMLRRLHN